MSALFSSADQLAPSKVLFPEEEALWRLGEPFELWYVPGRRLRPNRAEKLVTLYLTFNGGLVREVGEAPELLMAQVGGLWDGTHFPATTYEAADLRARVAFPPRYVGGCLVKTNEMAVTVARLKTLGVVVPTEEEA